LIQQSIDQKLSNSQELPRTSKNATTTARRQIRTSKPSQSLHSHHDPTASPAKLPIHRSETRTNGKTSNQPIENRANSKKLQETDRKLEQTVENFKVSIKTQTNGGKLDFTEQKLERTVENGCTSTQPHRNYRNFKNSRCGWEQVLHGTTVGA